MYELVVVLVERNRALWTRKVTLSSMISQAHPTPLRCVFACVFAYVHLIRSCGCLFVCLFVFFSQRLKAYSNMHAHSPTSAHTPAHENSHPHPHSHTHAHTRTHKHTCTPTDILTHTFAWNHTSLPQIGCQPLLPIHAHASGCEQAVCRRGSRFPS